MLKKGGQKKFLDFLSPFLVDRLSNWASQAENLFEATILSHPTLDPNIPDGDGKTSLIVAIEANNKDKTP